MNKHINNTTNKITGGLMNNILKTSLLSIILLTSINSYSMLTTTQLSLVSKNIPASSVALLKTLKASTNPPIANRQFTTNLSNKFIRTGLNMNMNNNSIQKREISNWFKIVKPKIEDVNDEFIRNYILGESHKVYWRSSIKNIIIEALNNGYIFQDPQLSKTLILYSLQNDSELFFTLMKREPLTKDVAIHIILHGGEAILEGILQANIKLNNEDLDELFQAIIKEKLHLLTKIQDREDIIWFSKIRNRQGFTLTEAYLLTKK